MMRTLLVLPLVILAACQPEEPKLGPVDGRFVINADPQMGPAASPLPIVQRLNQLLGDFVSDINKRHNDIDFVVFNGDLVSKADKPSFDNFVNLVRPIKVPVRLVHGNHDGVYPDTTFLEAQAALGQEPALNYSFDQSGWHFVMIPAQEMLPTDEDKAALLAWLREDLAKAGNKPSMVFLHYHLLPIGLSQTEFYTLPMDFKNALVDTLTEAGNVRYVFSGHVHAGIKSSIKSSWTYRGTNFVIVPSPVPLRPFGEEFDKFKLGDRKDGRFYLDVELRGDQARLIGREIGSDLSHVFPDQFQAFEHAIAPRAFKSVADFEPEKTLENGSFESGLDGWYQTYRYKLDGRPAYRTAVQQGRKIDGSKALRMEVVPKGRVWANEESMEIYQVVGTDPNISPSIKASIQVPKPGRSHYGGGYFRIVGFSESERVVSFLFHWGAREERVHYMPLIFNYAETGESGSLHQFAEAARACRALSWRIPDFGPWQKLSLNLAQLMTLCPGQSANYEDLAVDKIMIAAGVWTGSEPGGRGLAFFDDISVDTTSNEVAVSKRNGFPLRSSSRVASYPYGAWGLDNLSGWFTTANTPEP